MKRKLIVLGIAALLLVSTVSIAGNRSFNKPQMPHVGLKNIYDRTAIFRFNDDGTATPLPRPVGEGFRATATTEVSVPGPFAGGTDAPILLGAMVQPRGGGSMFSAQQRAEQDIRRLIRRLN